jgi:two-component system, sensor histidine kinase and response regulator
MKQKEKVTILYLDDEPNNLNSFKAAFRFDYNVLLAQNIAEADTHLNNPNNHIEVVLSDQRMPEMTGVEYFEKIRHSHPHCIRLLITGFSDIESVIEAINRGQIFRYIKKPWVELDIKSAIEEAYKFYLATSLLEKQNNDLRIAYNELNKFAYSVAHDFKGPVMSIQAALNIIEGYIEEPSQKELVVLTSGAAEKLHQFVDSMFDYYRLNQGELQITDINFNDLAQYYNELFKVEAKVSNVFFNIKVSQNKVFRTDETKLKIILNNLINNAFKYLKKDAAGEVLVEITATSENAVIEVKDNGIGIAQQYIDSIFDMFYRASTHAPGSGFGLYNVKDAVSKLDGKIEVKSTPQIGSIFTVTIPTK